MALILGIDTGGTCTDAVIFDTPSQKVLHKSKAFTTKQRLQAGIRDALQKLHFDSFSSLDSVHLSTTLAVNSILEKRIADVGAVLLGSDLDQALPCSRKYVAPAQIGPIALNEHTRSHTMIQELISEFSGGMDALIVSSHGVRRNPQNEENMARLLRQLFSVPVYCAKDLSANHGFYERTVTCLLNAGLIPVIREWLDAVTAVLTNLNISAPVYIMKSNGTLMDTETAMEKPIRTLMSGPAASVAGGRFLTKEKDFLLIDMGGTSADVTKVTDGLVRMRKGPTKVNDFPVSLRAIDIQSFPIGGDSHIYYNQMGKLTVGPQKVIPLCVAANTWPHLYQEFQEYQRTDGYEMFTAYDTDCYMLGSRKHLTALNDTDRSVVRFLKEKPHSLFYIADHFHTDPDALHLNTLVNQRYLQRISFTPTDLLHVTGKYVTWFREISCAAASRMAQIGKQDLSEFLRACETLVTEHLVFSCMQSIANFEQKGFDFRSSEATLYLIDKYLEPSSPYFDIEFNIRKPIVAVGAPSGSWMQQVADKLGTKLILPPDFEVANAIGAAVSNCITEREEPECHIY